MSPERDPPPHLGPDGLPSPSFDVASAIVAHGPGLFTATIPTSWYQGRGAFGGLLAAQVLRAMRAVAADDARVPRSLTVHFCAPVKEGGHRIAVTLERAGASVSHMTARVTQQDGVVAVATCTLAAARPGPVTYLDVEAPSVVPWREQEALPFNPMMPVFTQHYAFRFCGGGLPYSGGDRAEVMAWLEPRVPTPLDPPHMVSLLDALPPAVLSRITDMRMGASVDFTVHFLDVSPRPGPMTEPVLLHSRSVQGADGYTEELVRLFSAEGRLLAQCRQLVALTG